MFQNGALGGMLFPACTVFNLMLGLLATLWGLRQWDLSQGFLDMWGLGLGWIASDTIWTRKPHYILYFLDEMQIEVTKVKVICIIGNRQFDSERRYGLKSRNSGKRKQFYRPRYWQPTCFFCVKVMWGVQWFSQQSRSIEKFLSSTVR